MSNVLGFDSRGGGGGSRRTFGTGYRRDFDDTRGSSDRYGERDRFPERDERYDRRDERREERGRFTRVYWASFSFIMLYKHL